MGGFHAQQDKRRHRKAKTHAVRDGVANFLARRVKPATTLLGIETLEHRVGGSRRESRLGASGNCAENPKASILHGLFFQLVAHMPSFSPVSPATQAFVRVANASDCTHMPGTAPGNA